MKIRVSKSLAQVAQEFARERDFGWEPKLLEDGYVTFRPDSSTEFGKQFYSEWEASDYPFGEASWRSLWSEFGHWVQTDPESVHGRDELPDDGVAVLLVKDWENNDEFAVVLQQWVKDLGWWEWYWHPVAIIARA